MDDTCDKNGNCSCITKMDGQCYFNPKYVKELTANDFEGAKLKKKGPVVVMFFATYCGFCTQAKPEYLKFAQQAAFMKVYCINGPENTQVKECINIEHDNIIKGWPTIMFFCKDGKPVFVVPPNRESRTSQALLKQAMKVCSEEKSKL